MNDYKPGDRVRIELEFTVKSFELYEDGSYKDNPFMTFTFESGDYFPNVRLDNPDGYTSWIPGPVAKPIVFTVEMPTNPAEGVEAYVENLRGVL